MTKTPYRGPVLQMTIPGARSPGLPTVAPLRGLSDRGRAMPARCRRSVRALLFLGAPRLSRISHYRLSPHSSPVPTVAAVNGHAIAGGMVLALACDYRICVEGDVTLGLTEVRVGVPFPVAAIEVARGALSPAAARTLVQFGETVGPARALELDAMDELAPAGDMTTRAMAVASNLTHIPAATYQAVKHQLRRPSLAAIADAIDHGADPTLDAWLTEETAAAARAILEDAAA